MVLLMLRFEILANNGETANIISIDSAGKREKIN